MNYRIIDVNINRLQESLRVIEDIARFEYNNIKLVEKIKQIRHEIKNILKKQNLQKSLILARDIKNDKAKFLDPTAEFKRDSIEDIFIANVKRAQESCRVLEEITKLINENLSKIFKKIRFKFYDIEKEIIT